ncbi:hypothetical protein A9762_19665 [Pandoraea sp. ISTKB]|nr:hypothetical protein A9762_19665 [Pandoraea sp. ISTKB]
MAGLDGREAERLGIFWKTSWRTFIVRRIDCDLSQFSGPDPRFIFDTTRGKRETTKQRPNNDEAKLEV